MREVVFVTKRERWVVFIFDIFLTMTSIIKYIFQAQSYALIAGRIFIVLLIAFLLYLGWKAAYGVLKLRWILLSLLAALFIPVSLTFLLWWQQKGRNPFEEQQMALAAGWITLMAGYHIAWEKRQKQFGESAPLVQSLSKRNIALFSVFGVLLILVGFVKNAAVARQFAIGSPYDGKEIPDEVFQRIMDLEPVFHVSEMAFGVLFTGLLLYAGWQIAYGLLKWWQVLLVVTALRIVPALIEFAFQPQDRSVWLFLGQDVFHTAVWVFLMCIYYQLARKSIPDRCLVGNNSQNN